MQSAVKPHLIQAPIKQPHAPLLQELALLDYSCLKHEPSRLAAAALLVAEAHTGMTANLERLTAVTGYSPACLQVASHTHSLAPAIFKCLTVQRQRVILCALLCATSLGSYSERGC